ncbi:MAG: antitoxin MazE family protein [Actinomycetota bacterium]|nr:antitoxin MazE family protein [Actinomycetota bacterium]
MAGTRDRVRAHRARLREQGLRPVQIWVPDVRAPEFVAQAHHQSAVIAASEYEGDDQDFVDAISADWDAEGEPDR